MCANIDLATHIYSQTILRQHSVSLASLRLVGFINAKRLSELLKTLQITWWRFLRSTKRGLRSFL